MKIDIDLSFRKAKILIDGKPITRVRALKVNASADEIPTVILELVPDEVNINGDAFILKDVGLENYSDKELLDFVAKRCISKAANNG